MPYWLTDCEIGHSHMINDPVEIYDDSYVDYLCPDCLAIGKINPVKLKCSHCAEGNHPMCYDYDLLECSCFCHDDSEYVMELLRELEV